MAKQKRQGTGKPDPMKDRTAHDAARGKRKGKTVSLAHIGRTELSDDEFSAALSEMHKETDRAAAIMGAALVDDGLTTAINSVLENAENEEALWFDQGAPFGTLRAKTVAAYALGLCTKKVAADIDAIRAVRNQFSHALRAFTFQHQDIAEICSGLDTYAPVALPGGPKPDPKLPRSRYETACTGIWVALMRKGVEVQGERINRLRAQILAEPPNVLMTLNDAIAASLKGRT